MPKAYPFDDILGTFLGIRPGNWPLNYDDLCFDSTRQYGVIPKKTALLLNSASLFSIERKPRKQIVLGKDKVVRVLQHSDTVRHHNYAMHPIAP